MMLRTLRLTAAESVKLFANPVLYVSLVLIASAAVSGELAQGIFGGQKETVWRNHHAIHLFAYGFRFGMAIATLVLLVFSSMIFAGEFDRGTVKNLLTRPVTRTDVFAAKGVAVGALAAILYGFTLTVSLALALGMGELGPVWDDSMYLMWRDSDEILGHARKAVLMGFLPFLAAGGLGILVSNLTQSSGYAVAGALVLFLFGSLLLGEHPGLFLHHGTYPIRQLEIYARAGSTRWDPRMEEGLLFLKVPLFYIAGFLPAAWAVFRSRDITA